MKFIWGCVSNAAIVLFFCAIKSNRVSAITDTWNNHVSLYDLLRYMICLICFVLCLLDWILMSVHTCCTGTMAHTVHSTYTCALCVCTIASRNVLSVLCRWNPCLYKVPRKNHPVWLGDHSHLKFQHLGLNPGHSSGNPVHCQQRYLDNMSV